MNYLKIYNDIIKSAQLKNRTKNILLEKHHIIPRSCGGDNSKENLVLLTTREHFICHLLLVKIYKDTPIFYKKMIYALWLMSKTRKGYNEYRVTSHSYSAARIKFSENNPNKCIDRKKKFLQNHKSGVYNYDYDKVRNTLKSTLSLMSKEDMDLRMKNSVQKCDHKKRGDSIKKGKSSTFLMTTVNNETIEFSSYDDVLSITGYTYRQIKYRLQHYNGLLENGACVTYISKYRGNDGNIGRKRNISI
jgi:hypothetical protein